MDNLLNQHTIFMSQCLLDAREECAVHGDFTLPDYCRDIAVVLKCIMTPYVQNRQWSGDQLLVDIAVNVRLVYLDEERCAPRTVEFAVPASCSFRAQGQGTIVPACVDVSTKYSNCRAVGPRRIEVSGALVVVAKAEVCGKMDLSDICEEEGLYTRTETAMMSFPMGCVEKLLTIQETVDFPDAMPAAEMLLGGDCRAVVKECKLLSGKAIVKGQVYVHQLYAADLESGECHCVDFVLPYSQILDVDGVEEGLPYRVKVQIVGDTERCTAGNDGENTALDIMVKLLVQLQVFRSEPIQIVSDAYHTAYPVASKTEDICPSQHLGTRHEMTVLPMKIPLSLGRVSKILDVWVMQQGHDVECRTGSVAVHGRWFICVLAQDLDGQVVYMEHPEEYSLEFAGHGNRANVTVTVTELHYRVIDEYLELQVGVCVTLEETCAEQVRAICQLLADKEHPFAPQKAGLVVYYAHAGECVWDISARCRTSPQSICKENHIAADVLPHSTMLLVPIVP